MNNDLQNFSCGFFKRSLTILTLEHIANLSSINTCSLVDSAGSVVTELSPSTISELSLVHSCDVNLSATFVDKA